MFKRCFIHPLTPSLLEVPTPCEQHTVQEKYFPLNLFDTLVVSRMTHFNHNTHARCAICRIHELCILVGETPLRLVAQMSELHWPVMHCTTIPKNDHCRRIICSRLDIFKHSFPAPQNTPSLITTMGTSDTSVKSYGSETFEDHANTYFNFATIQKELV